MALSMTRLNVQFFFFNQHSKEDNKATKTQGLSEYERKRKKTLLISENNKRKEFKKTDDND